MIGQFIASGTLLAVNDWTTKWAYKLPFALQWIWPIPLFILVTLAPGLVTIVLDRDDSLTGSRVSLVLGSGWSTGRS